VSSRPDPMSQVGSVMALAEANELTDYLMHRSPEASRLTTSLGTAEEAELH